MTKEIHGRSPFLHYPFMAQILLFQLLFLQHNLLFGLRAFCLTGLLQSLSVAYCHKSNFHPINTGVPWLFFLHINDLSSLYNDIHRYGDDCTFHTSIMDHIWDSTTNNPRLWFDIDLNQRSMFNFLCQILENQFGFGELGVIYHVLFLWNTLSILTRYIWVITACITCLILIFLD